MSGAETFRFRIDPQVVTGRSRPGPGSDGKYEALVDRKDRELFEHLRETRLTLARTHNVPACMIFSDRTLTDMAVRRPRTPVELKLVHGVGDVKARKFGQVFLSAIDTHVSAQVQHGLPVG